MPPDIPRRTEDSNSDDYRGERRWHFEKTVNISHIIATVTIAVSLISYVLTVDQRITRLESQLAMQTQITTAFSEDVKGLAADVRNELRLLRGELIQYIRDVDRKTHK